MSTAIHPTLSNGNGFHTQSGPSENGHENESIDFESSNLITDAILEEERRLEEKMKLEEEQLRQKIAEKQKALELKKEEEDKCFKRLHLLLSRSSVFAKFMADTLKEHESVALKKEEKRKQLDDNVKKSNGSVKRGLKRKANSNLIRKKKQDSSVNMLDVFKKENMENIEFNETQNSTDATSNNKKILESQPNLLYGGIMRSYQLEGFHWLKTLFENAVNGILADEMGLGKTIQCIALIAYLIEMGVPGPFFICGPLSTVPNWCAEFKRFTPDIPVVLYHGTKFERGELRLKIHQKVKVRDFSCYPVVITSYQIALNDVGKLMHTKWKMLVLDEAHRIKNFQCKLVEALKKYNSVHRLLLTGTPLQNDLSELWSLLNFIIPDIFNDLQVFQTWFDVHRFSQKSGTQEIIAQEQEKHIVSTIHQILTPFLLRRTKADVELSLPPKKEVAVHAPLTSLQQEYYSSVLNKGIRALLNAEAVQAVDVAVKELPKRKGKRTSYFGCESEDDFQVLPVVANKVDSDQTSSEVHLKLGTLQMCLRQICCHPYLVSYPLDPGTGDYLVDENIVKTSGKLLVLDCMLSKLKERGHKVLLFSQFVSMLNILEDYCTFRNYKFRCLNGSMNLADRQEQVKSFNEDESVFIFLISTRAGGLGINLTAADTVIIYDSDWNPQSDLQAQDRCHRIGQTKPVVVYRLLVPNTIDERIITIASAKRKLEKVIIQKGRFASTKTLGKEQIGITKEELLELLESSDVNGFVKTDENSVLKPEELEELLDRSKMVSKAK